MLGPSRRGVNARTQLTRPETGRYDGRVGASPCICRRWLLTGRVQGVGFRWFVWQAASALELAGTVRNLPGGVEVVARGGARELDRLQERLRQGPPGAHVQAFSCEEAEMPAGTAGFHIIHTP
jgi:acylphosphatase